MCSSESSRRIRRKQNGSFCQVSLSSLHQQLPHVCQIMTTNCNWSGLLSNRVPLPTGGYLSYLTSFLVNSPTLSSCSSSGIRSSIRCWTISAIVSPRLFQAQLLFWWYFKWLISTFTLKYHISTVSGADSLLYTCVEVVIGCSSGSVCKVFRRETRSRKCVRRQTIKPIDWYLNLWIYFF